MRFTLLLPLLLILDCSHGQIILHATIQNVKDGSVILQNTTANKIDSLQIKNNSFEYVSDLTEPTLFYLELNGFNDLSCPVRLILSPRTTVLTFTDFKRVVRGRTVKGLYPNRAHFISDPNGNDMLEEFEKLFSAFADTILALYPSGGQKDSLLADRKNLYETFIRESQRTIEANPDKIISAIIIYEFLVRNGLIDIKKTVELFNKLSESIKYSSMGTRIGEYINKEHSLRIGSVAPSFQFKDINSGDYKLSDFAGKRVLLHFWSSNCGPCRLENGDVKMLAEINKDVFIINVSLDKNEIQWRKAINKDGLSTMVNVRDIMGWEGKTAQDYYILAIPTYYLIDEKGEIAGKGTLAEIKRKLRGEQ